MSPRTLHPIVCWGSPPKMPHSGIVATVFQETRKAPSLRCPAILLFPLRSASWIAHPGMSAISAGSHPHRRPDGLQGFCEMAAGRRDVRFRSNTKSWLSCGCLSGFSHIELLQSTQRLRCSSFCLMTYFLLIGSIIYGPKRERYIVLK